MAKDVKEKLKFEEVAVCKNPMESELYPATLREADIPHRTERSEDGQLTILVADGWQEDGRDAIARASKVFFGEETCAGPSTVKSGEPVERKSDAQETPSYEEEEELEMESGGLFSSDALPSPDETKLRPVWPAWALAALPGLGLGHLYAGSFQVFFYLFFCSLLGVLFFHFTSSYWSFLLNLFAWGVDLGFSAMLVANKNRRAQRAKKRLEEAESSFLASL